VYRRCRTGKNRLGTESAFRITIVLEFSSVKYATADTQILTPKDQIPKIAISGVSGLVSGVFMGSPLVFGGICPRFCALFGCEGQIGSKQKLR
jgi:hypothetical protein